MSVAWAVTALWHWLCPWLHEWVRMAPIDAHYPLELYCRDCGATAKEHARD